MSALFGLFVVCTVPDHCFKVHLWTHILKKRLPRIFFWTFGVLLVIHGFENYFNVESWVWENHFCVLLIAVLVGVIPESGPHMVFVTLFAAGVLSLSILLASSNVQDGHGMLPMLAVSRRSFFWIKGVNLTLGWR